MSTDLEIVNCSFESHGAAILAIINDAIVGSTAVWDYEPRRIERVREWLDAREAGGYPVFCAIDADGTLLGFASYGAFRPWPGYKYTVEHSVFVHGGARRRGIGERLLRRLIATAVQQQYHVLVGAIDGANAASIALHEKLGFTRAGVIRQAGYKHRAWLDVVFYQLTLPTPEHPVEG